MALPKDVQSQAKSSATSSKSMSCFLKPSGSDCVCVDEFESDWNNIRERRHKSEASVCIPAGYKTVPSPFVFI